MLLAAGDYSYEIRRAGSLVATEEARVGGGTIVGARRAAEGSSLHEVEAVLSPDGTVARVSLRYSSSLFKRSANYVAENDTLRGSVSAQASRNEVIVKLGRFREVDAGGLMLFRALIIAHMRARGQAHWTGRVAAIDSNTLVAALIKHNCRRLDEAGKQWAYELRMGDAEQIDLDDAGTIVRRRDNRGLEGLLVSFKAAT
jgi:hypothetical protein